MKTASLKGPTELNLKRTLHGHAGHVTCLVTSSSFNLIVSGSKVSIIKGDLYLCLQHFVKLIFQHIRSYRYLSMSLDCFDL